MAGTVLALRGLHRAERPMLEEVDAAALIDFALAVEVVSAVLP